MRSIFLVACCAVFSIFVFVPKAVAQNTGGVFPPMVNEGHESVQWRTAINPDVNDDFRYASRLHYQKALDSDFMWRILGQVKNTASDDIDIDFIQGELFWELSDDDDIHKHGLRFDARLRPDSRAEQIGLNFMNQFNHSNGWRTRVLGLSSIQIGGRGNDGINLQSRFQIAKTLPGKQTLGIDMFNNYGNTGDIGDFNQQSHTLGPFLAMPIADKFSIYAGPLFGISDAAPDFEMRWWLTRSY